jgi:hypothetical protein
VALNEIRSAGVTAFDLFGILLPGVLLLVAVRIGLVPFNGPITSSFEQFGYATWIALLVLSYICGHLAQLIGRAVSRLLTLVFPWGEVFRLSVDQPDQKETAHALHTVRSYLHYRTGIDVRNLSDVVLSNLTDEFVEQYGDASELPLARSLLPRARRRHAGTWHCVRDLCDLGRDALHEPAAHVSPICQYHSFAGVPHHGRRRWRCLPTPAPPSHASLAD